jgi:Fic family protein
MRGRHLKRTWRYDPTLYAPARYRRACAYEAFLPDPIAGIEESFSSRTMGVVSDAERAVQRVGRDAAGALAPLARLLLRTESIASSKVEGLQIDVRDLATGEARADTTGKVNQATAEVLANIDAMELAIEEATHVERFAREHVTAIHHRLMAPTRPRIAGRTRMSQNWIGGNDYNPCGADFVPPPPEEVDALLDDLCEAIEGQGLPPLAQAALAHAQFETIHPFDDGNGRTGRALIHVVLRRRGLVTDFVPPISVEFARERDRYISGFTAYRHGEVDAWVEGFAAATARAADLAATYLDEVTALKQHWRALLSSGANPRADAAAWAIIEVMPAHPVLTAAVAGAATGRAKAAVHAALDQLADAGVLLELTGGRRNRSWEATGLLDLIADLEAGDLPRARTWHE